MRIILVVMLVTALLFTSAPAMAENAAPLRSLVQDAGASAKIIPASEAAYDSSAAPARQVHSRPMTRGGKIMTGIGIGLMGAGVAVIAQGATIKSSDIVGSVVKSYCLGSGLGLTAAGGALTIVGVHRRKKQ